MRECASDAVRLVPARLAARSGTRCAAAIPTHTRSYAIESMAYATTAMIDAGVVTPDAALEAAAVKVRGSEAMFVAINDCIQVLGGMGFSAGGAYPFERLLRDSRILLIFEGTNEVRASDV